MMTFRRITRVVCLLEAQLSPSPPQGYAAVMVEMFSRETLRDRREVCGKTKAERSRRVRAMRPPNQS